MKRPPKGRAPAQPKRIALPRLAILRRKPQAVSLFATVEPPPSPMFGPPAPPPDWQLPLPFPPEGGGPGLLPPEGGQTAPIAQGRDRALGGASPELPTFHRSVIHWGQLQPPRVSPCTFQPQGPAPCTPTAPISALAETPLAPIVEG